MFSSYLTNTGLAFLLAWSGRQFRGAWFWVGAQGLLTLGTLFDILPAEVPDWFPLVLGNTVYVSSCLFYAHAVWIFRKKAPFPQWTYGLIFVALLSFQVVLGQPAWVRSVVFSSWMSVGALWVGWLLLWKPGRDFHVSTVLTAFPFLALGISSVVRVFLFVFWGNRGEMEAVGTLNVWYVIGAILLSTLILFGYFTMVSLRVEQEMGEKDRELQARTRRLVDSNRSKDLFFSIIAHDLRGPIGGASRYVRKHLLGKMTGLEAKYAEVETLASALEKTNEFLEKLLWWSRAQLQDWTPAVTSIDLVKVFDQSLSLVRSAADLKEISIQLSPPPYPKPHADPESVQLILGNLLSNAVKFSLPGRVIRLSVRQDGELCRITVEDEGVGMDEKTIDRLFRIEDKLTTHGTTGERGSGLGLLLAQSLAERNHGGVCIESLPGVGTTATLWLPMQDPPSPR